MRKYMREYLQDRIKDPERREAYNAYMRRYMRGYKKRPDVQKKDAARRLIGSVVRSGLIPPASRLDCVECGNMASQYHHEDYARPFHVVPLCLACHGKKIHKD